MSSARSCVEVGRDYDEALQHCVGLAAERGLTMAHSTNDRTVIAGAATIALEIVDRIRRSTCW